MKNLFAFVAIYFAVSLLACQDANEEFTKPMHDLSSIKSVGHQIPVETGIRWMDLYGKKASAQGRLLSSYSVSQTRLSNALNSVDNLIGVAFHHAIDDMGVHHFILAPIDENLSVWSAIPGRTYIDANTDTEISREEARRWARNYEDAHPHEIWFHFFGSNIFDEIVAIPYFTTMNISPALNDLDLSPQLLLIISPEISLFNGRVNNESLIYDASSPCPPCNVE